MTIAFFGSSLVSAYWNGAATYYRGIIKALHALGHEIVFYEPDAYDRQKHRDIEDPDWARVVVYSGEGFEGVYQVLEEAEAADVIVKASGVGVFDEFLEKSVVEIKRRERAGGVLGCRRPCHPGSRAAGPRRSAQRSDSPVRSDSDVWRRRSGG